MDYERSLVAAYDLSNINPPDLGWKGNAQDLTGFNLVAATDIVEGVAGGKATQFASGSTQYMLGPAVNIGGVDRTIACWYRNDGNTAFEGIFGRVSDIVPNSTTLWEAISNRNGSPESITVQLGDGLGGNLNLHSTANVCPVGEWHHLVATITGGVRVDLYVDGIWNNGVVTALNPGNDARMVAVGRLGNSYLDGVVDSGRIYDAALTPLQVNDLMVAQRQGRK